MTKSTSHHEDSSMAGFYKDLFFCGTAVNHADLNSDARSALISHEFNSITAENAMKPEALLLQEQNQSKPEMYDESPAVDFSGMDPYLEFACKNGLKVRFHTFVWHEQTPEWFFHTGYDMENPLADPALMEKRLAGYMKKIFDHIETDYPGVVYAYDVVNEAFADDEGSLRSNSMWYRTLGADYVTIAFRLAREFAPKGAKLFINDYNEYQIGKREAIYRTAKELKKEGLIDGIGFQSHLDVNYPSSQLYEEALHRLGELGLEIQITELDVTIDADYEHPDLVKMYEMSDFERQADYYNRIMKAIVDSRCSQKANITCVTLWGLNDELSWRGTWKPLIFDDKLDRKPAYVGMLIEHNLHKGI